MMDVWKVREDFPILNTTIHGWPLVYLDNAATTQKPECVLLKIRDFYASKNSNIHRGVHYLSEVAGAAYEDARKEIKNFIQAASINEVIFTKGTTEAINLLANSFGNAFVGKGDEIIVSEMEHHSNILPWQVLCAHKQASLKVIPFDDTGRLMVEKLPSLLNERTKLVAVCHVSNALGVINPVEEIIAVGHQAGVPVMIDGAQSVPHFPVDVQKLDCDFLTFSGHKMYAETGIGVLYGKEKYLDKMPPYQTGGGMVAQVDFGACTYAGLPLKFEAGTVNYVGAISLAAAIQYMMRIGMEGIAQYESELIELAKDQLLGEKKLTLYGDKARHCSALSFTIEGVHPYDAGVILDKLGIAIRTGTHCAEPTMRHFGIKGTMRASFAMYNTAEEVSRLMEGLRKVQQILL